MTALKAEAPTKRETAITIQGRVLLIEAGPRVLTMRLTGRRYRYCLPWESAWNRAAEIEGRRRMQEARERRRLR